MNTFSLQAGNGGGFLGRDRPVSGVFSLDYGKIETSEDKYGYLSNGGPKLVEHNLDEIFGDEMSYKLPATMSSARSNMVIITVVGCVEQLYVAVL